MQQGEVYAKMKTAVDYAIESSLPQSAKGQFDALNRKYGMDMAISAMKPESQETFLAQLYHGASDQFYTFLGVTSPQLFKGAAQGLHFQADRGCDESGDQERERVGAGQGNDKLNPGDTGRADVMNYSDGKAAPMLTDVGAVGKSILDGLQSNAAPPYPTAAGFSA